MFISKSITGEVPQIAVEVSIQKINLNFSQEIHTSDSICSSKSDLPFECQGNQMKEMRLFAARLIVRGAIQSFPYWVSWTIMSSGETGSSFMQLTVHLIYHPMR